MPDQDVFHIVEEKVYRVIGGMLASAFPIVEFVGGRKNNDAVVTKLLSKPATIAAQIFDKLRFRIVTRSRDDILPILQYLTRKLFPFNYVVPGQSFNSVLSFRACVEASALAHLLPELQDSSPGEADVPLSDNRYSGPEYSTIHFVVDVPVRLPSAILSRAPASATSFGDIVFVRSGIPNRRPRYGRPQRTRGLIPLQVQGAPEEGGDAPPSARRHGRTSGATVLPHVGASTEKELRIAKLRSPPRRGRAMSGRCDCTVARFHPSQRKSPARCWPARTSSRPIPKRSKPMSHPSSVSIWRTSGP